MPRGIQDPAWTGMGASTINPSMSFEWTFRGISSYISWLCINGHVHDSNQMHHRKEHEQLRKADILVCKSKREYPHYTLSNHLLLSLDSIMRRPISKQGWWGLSHSGCLLPLFTVYTKLVLSLGLNKTSLVLCFFCVRFPNPPNNIPRTWKNPGSDSNHRQMTLGTVQPLFVYLSFTYFKPHWTWAMCQSAYQSGQWRRNPWGK